MARVTSRAGTLEIASDRRRAELDAGLKTAIGRGWRHRVFSMGLGYWGRDHRMPLDIEPAMAGAPFAGRQVWRRETLQPSDWTVPIPLDCLAELRAALAAF